MARKYHIIGDEPNPEHHPYIYYAFGLVGNAAMYGARYENDELLYVGITTQNPPSQRLQQHASDKKWWRQRVRTVQIMRLASASWSDALKAERAAILKHQPRFNGTHNPNQRWFLRTESIFKCDDCGDPASVIGASSPEGYVDTQYHQWWALCSFHANDRLDDLNDIPELFSMRTDLISSTNAVATMVEHLADKRWFNEARWESFLDRSVKVVAW